MIESANNDEDERRLQLCVSCETMADSSLVRISHRLFFQD